MTGWGQDGPLAKAAGHDINYIALTGALAAIGPQGSHSIPPLNLVGDFGGGSLYLAFGIASALVERAKSGKGQVIDAAIVDGTASLLAMFNGRPLPLDRERSLLGGAAPYYRCYVCADGEQIAIGALEPKFYAELMERIGMDAPESREDCQSWPDGSDALAAVFRTKTRPEWSQILEGTDACFAPVLTLAEAPAHEHMKARGTYETHQGVVQPGPAPRLSRTPGAVQSGGPDGVDVLNRWSAG
jgi:alpha-methylacyl-CoA racemase